MKIISLVTISIVLLLSCHSNTNNVKQQTTGPVLLSSTHHRASCVYLTKDANNNPLVSWCEMDTATHQKQFFFAFFNKENNRFSAPVAVSIEQNAILHEEGMPKMAVKGDGTLVAVYETSAPTAKNGWAGFIHYVQSFDRGKTWTQPLCVHSDTTSGKTHSYASITRLSDGEIGACWLDVSLHRNKEGRPVLFAKTNGRNGFGKEIIIDSTACECCRTAISSDDKGKISIAFRNIIQDSIRDMSLSTSEDNGNTFSRAVSFSNDNWVINGCPENGPSVVTTAQNSYAVWFSGGNSRGIHYAELDNNRKVILKKEISANGRFIQLCVLPDNKKVLVYNEAVVNNGVANSKIVADKIENGNLFTEDITPKENDASYPVVQSAGEDNIVVAWKEDNKIYYKTVAVHSITKSAIPTMLQTEIRTPDFSHIQLASTKDEACGMPLHHVADTAYYKGKVYGFCSKECKDKFVQKKMVI